MRHRRLPREGKEGTEVLVVPDALVCEIADKVLSHKDGL